MSVSATLWMFFPMLLSWTLNCQPVSTTVPTSGNDSKMVLFQAMQTLPRAVSPSPLTLIYIMPKSVSPNPIPIPFAVKLCPDPHGEPKPWFDQQFLNRRPDPRVGQIPTTVRGAAEKFMTIDVHIKHYDPTWSLPSHFWDSCYTAYGDLGYTPKARRLKKLQLRELGTLDHCPISY